MHPRLIKVAPEVKENRVKLKRKGREEKKSKKNGSQPGEGGGTRLYYLCRFGAGIFQTHPIIVCLFH